MRFAFIIMGDFDSKKDIAYIHNKEARIVGVSTIEEACKVAQELKKEEIDCIELCGAFGEEGTQQVIQATECTVPVGYVVHMEAQNKLFQELFSNR